MHFSPGDIVQRRKGLVMHKGLVLSDGMVLHNTPMLGEHLSSVDEFAKGRRVRVEGKASADWRQRQAQAAETAARSYNLFTNNCEHTAYSQAHGRSRSPQLLSIGTGMVVGAVVLAITRRPSWALTGYSLAYGLMHRILARDLSTPA